MDPIRVFFGSLAPEVETRRRAIARARNAGEVLQARISSLTDQLAKRRRESESEIAAGKSRIEVTDRELREIERLTAKCESVVAGIRKVVDSFWGRLGVRLRHMFSDGALSVRDLLDQLKVKNRELNGLLERLDELSDAQNTQTMQLKTWMDPIRDDAFAIEMLQQELDKTAQASAENQRFVRDAIRQVVQRLSPLELQFRKSQLESPQIAQALVRAVFDLQRVLRDKEASIATAQLIDAAANVPAAQERLLAAVKNSLRLTDVQANGEIAVEGHGMTHVKKTRVRHHSVNDAHGRSQRRSRTETYWEKVRVRLQGTLAAHVDVEYHSCDMQVVIESLVHECETWFRVGKPREGKSAAGTSRQDLQHQMEHHTLAIAKCLGLL